MAMTYTLTQPLTVGDINHQITVHSLKIISVSFNMADAWTQQGIAVLSVCLADPTTGYPLNIVYQDASVPAFFAQLAPTPTQGQTMRDVMELSVLSKLIADGKLPPGSVTSS